MLLPLLLEIGGAVVISFATKAVETPLVPSSVPSNSLPAVTTTRTTMTTMSAVERQEYYVPRLLYPGTYGNFCGPTPEVKVTNGCTAHGWHGDEPVDAVDEVCRLHDVAYCTCQSDLAQRRLEQQQQQQHHQQAKSKPDDGNDGPFVSSLASLTALRFWTQPMLLSDNGLVDAEYLKCVNRADKKLIASGIRIRGEQQRQGCASKDGSSSLSPASTSTTSSLGWFCSPKNSFGTLSRFEKVSLNIFLRSLDADNVRNIINEGKEGDDDDDNVSSTTLTASLMNLETTRQLDFQKALRKGKTIQEAASGVVEQDDIRILKRLGMYLDKERISDLEP